jgi:hypothetical protein
VEDFIASLSRADDDVDMNEKVYINHFGRKPVNGAPRALLTCPYRCTTNRRTLVNHFI